MTKQTIPPEIEQRLALASRLREEAQERREERPPRRAADVATARKTRERRRDRFRAIAQRGALPRNRTDELAALFSDAELRALLIEDAAGKESRAVAYARQREQQEVKALAGQVARERAAEQAAADEAEAAERLGLS